MSSPEPCSADILIFKSGQRHVGGSFFHPLPRAHHTSPSAENRSRCQASVRVSRLIAVSCPKTDSLRHHRVAAYSPCSLRLTASVSCLQPLHIVANACLFNPLLFYLLKYLISMTWQFFATDFAVGIMCVLYVHTRVCVGVWACTHAGRGPRRLSTVSLCLSSPCGLIFIHLSLFCAMGLHTRATVQVLRTVCGDWFFPSTT